MPLAYRPIATVSKTREILNKYDLHAKKNFGQNFLIDSSVSKRMAESISSDSCVIEIGPGIGSLTEELCRHNLFVRAYEVDERLIPVLEDTLSEYSNVEIILKDFLTIDIDEEFKNLVNEYKKINVVANLPYYITTPVLFKLFESNISFEKIVVMIQKEVADRFCASINTKEYGALSVEAQYLYDVKRLFNVPRTAYNPSPNVDSAVISFTRHDKEIKVKDEKEFFELIKACFKQRRKTIYNNLKEYFDSIDIAKEVLASAKIDETVRAEALSLEDYIRLYNVVEGIK